MCGVCGGFLFRSRFFESVNWGTSQPSVCLLDCWITCAVYYSLYWCSSSLGIYIHNTWFDFYFIPILRLPKVAQCFLNIKFLVVPGSRKLDFLVNLIFPRWFKQGQGGICILKCNLVNDRKNIANGHKSSVVYLERVA